MEASHAKEASTLDWNTIILAAIALLGTTITGITGAVTVVMAFLMAKMKQATDLAVVSNKETAVAAAKTAESLEKVHVAVNSERTAMTEELKKLRDEITKLTKEKATLEEELRLTRPRPTPTK